MRSSSASSVTSVLSAQNVLYERQRKIKLVGGADGRLLPSDLACTNVIATLRTSPEPAGSHRLQAASPVFAQLISPKSLRFISLVLNAITLIALNVPRGRYFPTGITRCCASAIDRLWTLRIWAGIHCQDRIECALIAGSVALAAGALLPTVEALAWSLARLRLPVTRLRRPAASLSLCSARVHYGGLIFDSRRQVLFSAYLRRSSQDELSFQPEVLVLPL